MPITYELIASAGKYTNKEGQEKNRWVVCGKVFEKDGKQSVKIDSLPVPFDGWLMMREPMPRDNAPAKQAAKPTGGFADDLADDMPF
jgi:hypothetical protein